MNNPPLWNSVSKRDGLSANGPPYRNDKSWSGPVAQGGVGTFSHPKCYFLEPRKCFVARTCEFAFTSRPMLMQVSGVDADVDIGIALATLLKILFWLSSCVILMGS